MHDQSAFEALFRNSSLGIIISNTDGVMERVNQFAANLFGYEIDEMIGQKIEILIPKTLRKDHVSKRDSFASKPSQRPMGTGLDLHAVRKDGSEFFVEISLSHYEIDGNREIVSFVNDVTEKKKIKQALEDQAAELEEKVKERTQELSHALFEINHTNENLEKEIAHRKKIEEQVIEAFKKEKELNELKSRFVSMASHEFRTPLAVILTSASLLLKYNELEGVQEKRVKHIDTIKKSVKNLTSILNDFLSLDKLEQGRIGAHGSRFHLKQTLNEIISNVSEISTGNQEVRFEFLGNDVEIFQDKDMLRNIMMNLISNAMKYSNDDQFIDVKANIINKNVFISVQDYGIGIPDKDQKGLFERFFRASNVTNIQGTGLGLTIVRKYLDFMGGDINFFSKQGEGTRFEVTFPLELENEKDITD